MSTVVVSAEAGDRQREMLTEGALDFVAELRARHC